MEKTYAKGTNPFWATFWSPEKITFTHSFNETMNDSGNISAEWFFRECGNIPLIDVRSPGEYHHAHLPQAHNIPLFDDGERARIGTTYKMKGREAAIMQGLELAGPKLSLFLEKARMLKIENDMVVHCWRGGMRSRAMAWLYNFAGFRCHVIEGGYKACRQTMKAFLGQPFRLIILGGMTGSGKTEILHELRRLGEQVIDLEFLAHHKGSAFGGIGQLGQPSTEQFENNLFKHWFKLDPRKPIWIEDESKSIGSVSIPDEIFLQMRRNPVLELRVDRDCRIERLVRDYAGHDPQKLKTSVERIHKRLGGQVVQESMRAIDTGQYAHAADLILNYYDRRYTMGLNRRPAHSRHPVPVANASLQRQAQQVLDAAGKLGFYREKEVHFHDV